MSTKSESKKTWNTRDARFKNVPEQLWDGGNFGEFKEAISVIDSALGDGYAESHPEVLAAVACQVMACPYGNIEDALNAIAAGLERLAQAVEQKTDREDITA